jgi:hypothetical protein
MRGVSRSIRVKGLRSGEDVVLAAVIDSEQVMAQVWVGGVHTVVVLSDLLNAMNGLVLESALADPNV